MSVFSAPAKGVSIRMYRQGLGDCFLLAFPGAKSGETYHVLIDCGVIFGNPQPVEKMTAVAKDILDATGGELDLLVITHEHFDHVSGFLQAAPVFEKLLVHNVWFAWTEDPDDALANELRRDFQRTLAALGAALSRARNPLSMSGVQNILGFFGDPSNLAASGSSDTASAMKAIREMAKKSKGDIFYLSPGDGPLSFPKGASTAKGVRTFVLGPPKTAKTLRKINPSKNHPETYHGFDTDRLEMAVAPGGSPNGFFPFEERLRIPTSSLDAHPFFAEHYCGATDTESWRRIDDDWLGGSEEIALSLDSYTNNTSLVLAFELIPSRKILLFVGDAQVGNWLSWDDLSWKVKNGVKEVSVTASDMLKRTILYKVGHHASHNATMQEKGLERMESESLIAFVPVDEEVAHEIKNWKKMPFIPLMQRLAEKTSGRVIRVDSGIPNKPANVPAAEWKKFEKATHETKLFVQVTVA